MMSTLLAEGASALVRAGGCAVWALPPDQRCASQARRLLTRTVRALGFLSDDQITDAAVVASEICTNAVRHSRGLQRDHRPVEDLIELWLYRRGDDDQAEVICAVADPGDGPRPDQLVPPSGKPIPGNPIGGRGLQVVAALTGRWGFEPTRFRQHPCVPGNAAWFAIPAHDLPPFGGDSGPLSPSEGIWRVGTELRARGIAEFSIAVAKRTALLQVHPTNLVVTCHAGTFYCRRRDPPVLDRTYPSHDITHLVEELIQSHERARHRPPASRAAPASRM